MSKIFEIELRGPLSKNQYKKLIKTLNTKGKFVEKKERILIDYSTFLKGEELSKRNKDIRLRVTNKKPEIIVKLGKWGGSDQREEISVFTENDSFDNLVKIFNALGYKKGMLCVRTFQIFKYKNIEFALVEIPNYGYFYEAEKITTTESKKRKTAKEIMAVCKSLDLDIYSDESFFHFIQKLNKNANEVFDFSDYTDNYFKKRFNL